MFDKITGAIERLAKAVEAHTDELHDMNERASQTPDTSKIEAEIDRVMTAMSQSLLKNPTEGRKDKPARQVEGH